MKYSNFKKLIVTVKGLMWKSADRNLPAEKRYEIGFDELNRNGVFVEDEDDPLSYFYAEDALEPLLTDMLTKEFSETPTCFNFTFTPRN